MIRELALTCSECRKTFIAESKLLYKDNFKIQDFSNIELVCQDCFDAWQNYWQIESAVFFEEFSSLYVNITLQNGDSIPKLDCTPMDDIVAVGNDIPLNAQKKLYQIYSKWYDEKMKDVLKTCTFTESFMRTSFTCETYGGKKYEDIAFRFTRQGAFEAESPVPEDIRKQVVSAWHRYELSNLPTPEIDDE